MKPALYEIQDLDRDHEVVALSPIEALLGIHNLNVRAGKDLTPADFGLKIDANVVDITDTEDYASVEFSNGTTIEARLSPKSIFEINDRIGIPLKQNALTAIEAIIEGRCDETLQAASHYDLMGAPKVAFGYPSYACPENTKVVAIDAVAERATFFFSDHSYLVAALWLTNRDWEPQAGSISWGLN